MKRFLSTVAFCVFLLVFGLLVLLPSASAERNLLGSLLDLPAPAPPNPLSKASRNYGANMMMMNASVNASDDAPPDDNAPIEELLEFWRRQNYSYQETGYNLKPSEQTLRRIVSHLGEKPEKLGDFLNILPEDEATQDFIKNIYDRQTANDGNSENAEEEDGADYGRVRSWLTYHSRYYSDELLKTAETVGDTGEYVSNQRELLALARVDWEKARPILERLMNDNQQPVSQTLARWAFYQHALKENDSSDIETYRKQLQRTVENKNAKPGDRDLAMDALVESGDFEGRDDWYYSLLEDETLYDLRVNGTSYTGLTTLLNRSPKEKYVPKMLELVASSNPTIRKAAVRNLTVLIDSKNPEVVKALLPWLENPEWAQEINGERRRIINALYNVVMPESVPGLIAVLNEKQQVSRSAANMGTSMNMMMSSNRMTNGNVANVNRPVVVAANMPTQYDYVYRAEAVSALAKQKDARAIAPLRDLLSQVEGWQLSNIVRALLASGGFSIPEQVEALEMMAKGYGRDPGDVGINVANSTGYSGDDNPPPPITISGNAVVVSPNYNYKNRPLDPSDIKPLLGQQLITQYDADNDLVTALIERIKILDVKEPATAHGLRRIMLNWRGAAINAMLMRDVRDDKADVDTVVKLLSLRKDLRENQSNDIADMRSGGATAFGISTCLLENPPDYDGLLQSDNQEAKTAMLACARLIRAALPVAKVAENLKSPNKMLALAAERYLETEDSVAAQNFVLAMHPNEAKITGAKKVFLPDGANPATSNFLSALFASIENSSGIQNYYYYDEYGDELANGEKRLKKELKEDAELLGVYSYDDNFIRIYKDKAVFSWQSDKARFRERELSKEEFEGFKNYLAAENVNELPPFFTGCETRCDEKELLMLGRHGGRRIYLLGDESPAFFSNLAEIFERMRQPPAKLRYALEKKIKGLEILFEDENLSAETVWKSGADFRVLTSDAARREQIDKELQKQEIEEEKKDDVDYDQLWAVRRKRRAQREYENFAWHLVTGDGKLGDLIDQPKGIEFIQPFDGSAVPAAKGQWKARGTNFEIRADSDGLYKIAGGRAAKIGEGYYENPVVTPNGKWAVVTKYEDEGGAVLTRVNLTTRKQFPVKFDAGYYPRLIPVANLPAAGKVLIFKGIYSEGESEEEEDIGEILTQPGGEFYLLDAETGAIEKAKGEVRPLAQQTFRPLQTTGNPDEFWAAIPDAEKEQTEVGVYNAKTSTFKSMLKIPDIEFDSMKMWVDEAKIYFVYQGHLLSLPLPKSGAATAE